VLLTQTLDKLDGLGLFGMAPSARADEPKPIEIGARRELFVDDFLIEDSAAGLRIKPMRR